jgi:hypothetical protein
MVRRTMIWRRILGFDLSHTESRAARMQNLKPSVTLKEREYCGRYRATKQSSTVPKPYLEDSYAMLFKN